MAKPNKPVKSAKGAVSVVSHCNECAHETNHDVLCEQTKNNDVQIDGGWFSYSERSRLLECCGCNTTSMQVMTFGRDFHEEPWIQYFPPRISRREPSFIDKIDPQYTPLLREVYSALHADSRILAAMGARTLLDTFITEKVGDQGNFSKGLDALVKEGHLSTGNKKLLEAAIDAGNASAHRAYRPSSKDLNAVMDIVENLLQQDVLLKRASELSASTPKRAARVKKTTKEEKSK